MSEAAEKKIEELEQASRVAQELLFLVLDHVGEPVVLDIEESKRKIQDDRIIDIGINDETNEWVLKVVVANG